MRLLLAQKKTDPNQLTSRGTALHLAAINEDGKCLELLLQHEADPEIQNVEGKRPVDLCR
jgi:ankyrin repeat protein